MGVLVQEMVRSDLSFVVFSQSPITGNSDEIYMEIAVGMGETLASAAVRGNPLRATMLKKSGNLEISRFPSFDSGFFPSEDNKLAKEVIDYSKERIVTDEAYRTDLLKRIGTIAAFLEDKLDCAQDIEGAVVEDTINIVQARPMVGVAAS